MSVEQLEAEALKLSAEDRARLAERLIESLDEEEPETDVEQAWSEEAMRRYTEMVSGAVVGVPADEALRQARERIR